MARTINSTKKNLTLVLLALIACSAHNHASAKNLENLKVAPKLTKEISKSYDQDGLKVLEDLPGYQPAVPIQRSRAQYPLNTRYKQQAGMVEASFMVDKNGNTFNPIITFSTNKDFEKSALNAIKKYKYDPAEFNGQPIDSSESIRLSFVIQGHKDAVSKQFNKLYKRAKRYLHNKEGTEADIRRTLDAMYKSDYLTMYSLSHLYILETQFATQFLDKDAQIEAIQRVLLFSDRVSEKTEILTESIIRSLRMNLLQLYIQTGRYGEARSEHHRLSKQIPDAVKPFKKAMKQVNQILRSDQGFAKKVNLTDRGYKLTALTKQTFSLDNIEGEITKLNFRCDNAYREIPFSPEKEFTIPNSWGCCNVEVVGTPNTVARLIQY